MNQTIVIDTKVGEQMIQAFRDLRMEVSLLRKTLTSMSVNPKYGTDLWWETMDKKAREDIDKRRGVVLKNHDDIDNMFRKLQ